MCYSNALGVDIFVRVQASRHQALQTYFDVFQDKIIFWWTRRTWKNQTDNSKKLKKGCIL